MPKEITTVRLQVPVREDVAKAVEKLANDLDRPSSWLAVELIKASLDDQKSFCDWIALAFVGKAYDTVKRLLGRRLKSQTDPLEVRLQLTAPIELVKKITRLAEQWNQTPVSAAGKLLASGVHNHELFLDGIVWGKRLSGKGRGVKHVET
jgi:predicted transcriptional regulator